MGPLSIDLYLPALPELAAAYGTSESLAQVTMASCMTGLALGQVVVGPISDSVGRRPPLLAGLTVYTLTSAFCLVAPTITALIAARAVQGFAGGTAIVIARAIVRDRCDADTTARTLAAMMFISNLAPIAAPVMGGLLLEIWSWKSSFTVLTVAGAILVAAVALMTPETLPPARRSPRGLRTSTRQIGEVWGDTQFRTMTMVLALGSSVLFGYISLSPFVLQHQFAVSPLTFSMVFAANSVGLLLFGLVSMSLIARFGTRTTMSVGLTIAVLGSSALILACTADAGLWLFLPLLFVTVSSVALVIPTATAIALSGQGDRSGTASGVLGTIQFGVGGLIGPAVSVVATSATAMSITMVIAAVLACVVSLRCTQPEPIEPQVEARP